MERTLALIKPDTVGQPWLEPLMAPVAHLPTSSEDSDGGEAGQTVDDEAAPRYESAPRIRALDASQEILSRVSSAGFNITHAKRVMLSKQDAELFYREHTGKPFFERLTAFMATGPVIALVLEKEGAAWPAWRELCGSTDPAAALAAAESAHPLDDSQWSLRALFGADGTRNAVHGSDSAWSAEREIAFFFDAPASQQRVERSIAIVDPSAAAAGETVAVASRLEAEGLLVLGHTSALLSEETARAALGRDATPERVAHLTSGPCDAFLVEGRGAIWRLRDLAGLAPPSAARGNNPASFHATLGGTDDTDVSFGVVAAPDAAAIATALMPALFPAPLPLEKTLALFKPGVSEARYRPILTAISEAGFTVVSESQRTLTREDVELFYAEHAGKPFFPALAAYMTSGPVVALALAKPCAVKSWRALCGPTNSDVARREAPGSLRALYGSDGTRNAVHGSDGPASAARELRFFFPELLIDPQLGGPAAAAYVKTARICDVFDPTRHAMVPKTLESVVTDALVALAKAKPSSSPAEAVRWLGAWLLDNNPRTGIVTYRDGATTTRRGGANKDRRAGAGGTTLTMPASPHAAPTVQAGATTSSSSASAPLGSGRTIVFVVAPPAVGKGTQCALIAARHGYAHLSTGDLLRAEVDSGSPLGATLTSVMQAGGLVSDDLVLALLQSAMAKSGGSRFLIDGYPRSLPQALAFEKQVGAPSMVLSFTAPDETLLQRALLRGQTSGRADDNADSFANRLATFRSQSQPVLDFYASVGRVQSVDATGTKEAVWGAVQPLFQPRMVWLTGPPGAGKTSGVASVAVQLGYRELSVSGLLAAHGASVGGEAAEVASSVSRGETDVPPALLVQLVSAAVEASGSPLGSFVLDGAPANDEQAAALEAAFGAPAAVIEVTAPDATLLARVRSKAFGAARTLLKDRLERYRKAVAPVIDLYRRCCLLRGVDGTAEPADVAAAARRLLQPRSVFVLGGPGSGKGTQCARIAAAFGWAHLSAGDLLRAEVLRGSPRGDAIQRDIAQGRIIPVETALQLLRGAVAGSRAPAFLIDGFPRALDQAALYEREVGAPEFVLFFDAPDDVLTSRLLERGKTSGRLDDNGGAIAKRLRTYGEQSVPVVSHYSSLGAVRSVDATRSPDAVWEDVRPLFQPRLVWLAGRPGAGASTQAARLCEEYGYAHVGLQDLVAAQNQRTAAVAAAAAVLSAAKPGTAAVLSARVDVPAEELDPLAADKLTTPEALQLLRSALAACGGLKAILEGFPRSPADAAALEAAAGPLACVLHLEMSADAVKARLQAPPKTAGAPQPLGAPDAESLAARLASFDAGLAPAIKAYARRGLVRTVTADAPRDAVYASLCPVFQPQLAVLVGTAGTRREELGMLAGRQLGYHTLRVGSLLRAHVAAGGRHAHAITEALGARRTLPAEVSVSVVRDAVRASGASRFLLDGFPRVVHHGFPGVHDQVFELESAVGPVKGCVSLNADWVARVARTGAATPGQLRELRERVQTAGREKEPVAAFFSKLGKAITVETGGSVTPAQVYEAARPFLE